MDSQASLRRPRLQPALRALRPHHWPKNLLVAVPAVASHSLDLTTWSRVALAFACFCAAASSGYLINDLLDADADRTLPYKGNRPLASGEFGRREALFLSVAMGTAAVAGACVLSRFFGLIIIAYLATSFGYSYFLKSRIILDVIIVAALLSMRVVGGGIVADIAPSNWLIMFCLFLFFSLSLAKRCSEIADRSSAGEAAIPRRGYRSSDLPILTSMGAAASYATVLVFAEYVASPEVQLLYSKADRLWLVVPFLIYWLSRILILANRGELNEDPVIFAFFDRATWAVGCSVAIIIAAAS